MTRSRARRPVLRGGRRRRRPGAALAALAIVLAPLVVAAAVYLTLTRDEERVRLPSVAVAAGAPPAEAGEPTERRVQDEPPPPGVRLAGVDAFSVRFRKPPRAGLVFDVRTGEVLWQRHPRRVLPIASLTKIMTALVVTDRTRPREPVRITRTALRYSGSGVGVLPRGKRVRLEPLLNGLLLVSGNDAAIALADHAAGGERRFVRIMNERARKLGLDCTRFVSSHGLEPGNRSCARDLATLTRLAMAKPRIRRIARRPQASFRFPIKGGRLFLTGHNPLIRSGYRGAIGLKTGYTAEAGRCFVGVARRGGRTLAVVLLDSFDPGRQARRLLDPAFRRR